MYFDPHTGEAGLPPNFLIWSYEDTPVYAVKGARLKDFSISVIHNVENALTYAQRKSAHSLTSWLQFSLYTLPVSSQMVYQILLTVPLGAFIIVLLRNFVGLQTFGTFMPVLIALSFRETELGWGLFLFSLLVGLGLIVRFYFEQLRLLLVPRLAAILTVVIGLMTAVTLFFQRLGVDQAISVALFPMVILTMTIERMCILWEERGASEAMKAGLGSLFAASLAYGAMHASIVRYLFFAFPELLFLLLGIILWSGQYRGYRLLELGRFRSFARKVS